MDDLFLSGFYENSCHVCNVRMTLQPRKTLLLSWRAYSVSVKDTASEYWIRSFWMQHWDKISISNSTITSLGACCWAAIKICHYFFLYLHLWWDVFGGAWVLCNKDSWHDQERWSKFPPLLCSVINNCPTYHHPTLVSCWSAASTLCHCTHTHAFLCLCVCDKVKQ